LQFINNYFKIIGAKMKKITQYLLILLFMGLVVSCSKDDDDDKKPTNNKEYFPLSTDTYWTYTKSQVLDDGSEVMMNYERQEVKGEETLDGHSTFKVETFVSESPVGFGTEADSKTNYYIDNGRLWASVSYLENVLSVRELNISFPLNTDIKFIKLIDANVDSWTAIEIPYDKFDFEALGFQVQFTGKATYKVKRLGERDFSNTALGLSGKAMAFEYETEIAGSTTVFAAPFGTINVKYKSEQWFMPEVGLVRRVDAKPSITGTGTVGTVINDLPPTFSNSFELYQYSVVK
jgi:hypothetical protein